ncbi:MAG: tripartite tricarboxylate transporter substrate binding protein [Betaproteobacteria bacterium]|nr:tripartite tricarboxylate transporter substrate binding protein [Betaproteobacteria bacterium]
MSTFRCAIGALLAVTPLLAAAQAYPTKPVRLIVPYASGNTDTTARIFALKLGERLGQQVVIDNRPGAGANIGAEIAARATPDGYVLFYASLSHAINASLYKQLNYNLVKDFAPISVLIASPYILTVHPSVPSRSVRELVAFAKSHPGQLNYASSGSTSHLAFEYLSMLAGVKMNHVPYKSGAPATVALISGQIEVALASASASMPHIKTGKLRGLGISTAARSPQAPDLPTIGEAGVPGYDVSTWHGLSAPAGTPRDIIARLNTESVALLKQPDVQERYRAVDSDVLGGTPEQFGALIRSEIDKWAKVVKESGAVTD